MPADDAFLRAIIDRPADDLPRLVYADWLDERGDPDRAAFIRVQCAMARPPMTETEFEALFSRSECLLRAHKTRWLGPLPEFVDDVYFRRGFPKKICLSAAAFLAHADTIWRLAPLPRIVLKDSWEEIDRLAMSPHLGRVVELSLEDNHLRDADITVLVQSLYIARLEELDIGGNQLGPAAMRDLASAPVLTGLRRLDVSFNTLRYQGIAALTQSPCLQQLVELDLTGNDIGPGGIAALANCAGLTELRVVHLGGEPLGGRGVRAILNGQCSARWRQLHLSRGALDADQKADLTARFGKGCIWFD